MKYLQFPDHLAALREGRVVAPVHIRIKPTNRCNHDCWYCAYRASNLQLGADMDVGDVIPADKMFEIVDDIVEMGVKAVTFSGGGEPLIYKPLPDCVERLARNGVRVATLTNGANLKGRMADAFAEHGTWVRVSLDAWDGESYAKSRGVRPDAFGKLLDNIRAFSARPTSCLLGVSFIVTKEDCRHIYEVCSMLKDAGVNHVKVSGVVVSNDAAGNNTYHRGLKKFVKMEIERAQTLADDNFSVLDRYHDLEERFEKTYTSCPFLQFLTVIGADLQVYTCQDKAYTKSGGLGSIADVTFKEFWFSEQNKERLFSLDPSLSCRHHCVSHAKNLAILETLSIDPTHGVFV